MKWRPRKWMIFKLLLFLFAGAIVNVAVAWGCATWSPVKHHEKAALTVAQSRYLDQAGESLEEQNVVVGSGVGIEQFAGNLADDLADERYMEWHDKLARQGILVTGIPRRAWVEQHVAGIPCRSVSGWIWCHSFGYCEKRKLDMKTESIVFDGAWPIADTRANATAGYFRFEPLRVLPLSPLFPGFAINTIFYAAISWVLFATPCALSRKRRRRRGQCVVCGYSLRECVSDKCPECGLQFVR